jgi:hypothetical protein
MGLFVTQPNPPPPPPPPTVMENFEILKYFEILNQINMILLILYSISYYNSKFSIMFGTFS